MDQVLFTQPRWMRGFLQFIYWIPIPAWLLALLVVVGVAGLYHGVAWRAGYLEFGQVNRNLATQGLYLITAPYYWVVLTRRAEQDLRRFFAESDKSREEIEADIADFNSLPEVPSILVVVLGSLMSISGYWFFALPAFPVIGEALPALNVAVYAYSGVMFSMILVRMLRQASIMRRLYAEIEVDLFTPGAIYALSGFAAFSSAGFLILLYLLVLAAFPAFILTTLGLAVQLFSFFTVGLLFFSPLAGINARMKGAKQDLLDSANEDLRKLYERIRAAARARDDETLAKLQGTLSTLRGSRDMIRTFPTWPWQPDTLRSLLAPLLFPIIIFLIQLLVTRVLGR